MCLIIRYCIYETMYLAKGPVGATSPKISYLYTHSVLLCVHKSFRNGPKCAPITLSFSS
jgi:hypothetical protein